VDGEGFPDDWAGSTDAILRDFGEVVQLIPIARDAEQWLYANLEPDAVWFGDGVLIEGAYIQSILDAMAADGLGIRIYVENRSNY
jgi:hypothetical protein